MTPYGNLNGSSGITAYEIRARSIVVEFRHRGKYLYDYAIPGETDVEKMKVLALEGSGLATYINREIRGRYAAKL
jgi:hypothetical protein